MGHKPGRRLVRARAALSSHLVDGIQGVADLLAFGREEHHLARVEELSQELADLQRRMAGIGGLQAALHIGAESPRTGRKRAGKANPRRQGE